MKNRRDQKLLAGLLLSAAFWVLCILIYLEIIPYDYLPHWLYGFCIFFALGGLVIPAYHLQMLLCRRAWRWVAALHILTMIGAALYFSYKTAVTTGWDVIGWLLLMVLSIAAAMGCAIAWVTHGGEQKDARE